MISYEPVIEQLKPLPNDPAAAWAAVADASLKRATAAMRDTSVAQDKLIIFSLANFLSGLRNSLGLDGHLLVQDDKTSDEMLDDVSAQIYDFSNQSLIAKIIAAVAENDGPEEEAIRVSNSGLVKILNCTAELRTAVKEADLDEKKKKKLFEQLDRFEELLTSRRITASRAFGILAILAAGVAGSTSTLADAPVALETIGKVTAYLGIEKEAEEELKLLTQDNPVLGLPSPEEENAND